MCFALLNPNLGTQSLVIGSYIILLLFFFAGIPFSILNFSHFVYGFSFGIGFSLGTITFLSGNSTLNTGLSCSSISSPLVSF
jgi:hypothetical protein